MSRTDNLPVLLKPVDSHTEIVDGQYVRKKTTLTMIPGKHAEPDIKWAVFKARQTTARPWEILGVFRYSIEAADFRNELIKSGYIYDSMKIEYMYPEELTNKTFFMTRKQLNEMRCL